jgi:hypothetical protein
MAEIISYLVEALLVTDIFSLRFEISAIDNRINRVGERL